MRLAALALILAPLQDSQEQAVWRRSMQVVNTSLATLPAGTQVFLKRPRHHGQIEVRYGDRAVAAWVTDDKVWFRIAADIKDYEIDRGYEIRYGGVDGPSRPSEVFEFFDEPGEKALDPAKWQIDPALKIQPDKQGAAITQLPDARTAHAPASMILKTPPGVNFVVDAEVRWEFHEKARLAFLMSLELDEEIKTTDEVRTTGARLLSTLAEEDIAAREEAFRKIVKLGRPVVPLLMDATRGEDAELRAQAAKAIDAIHKENPPSLIATGFSTETRDPKKLASLKRLGRAREEWELLSRSGSGVFTIRRSEDGWTDVPSRVSRPQKVPGKVGRIRFDFWGDSGAFGAVWIKRVIVRRDAAGFETILGNEEKVK